MAATKYTFSISTDFPNQKVASERLTQEIQQSAILTALDRIDTSGDDCDVWFKDALSAGDQTVLDGLVGAHSGDALEVVPPTTDEGVNYVTILPGKSGRMLIVEGIQFDALANADTEGDLVLVATRELQGASIEIANREKGDYIELLVVAPDGPPYEGAVVGQFGKTVYIPPSGHIDPITSESTASFPAGFKFRMVYHAVSGGATREVYVVLRMRRDV